MQTSDTVHGRLMPARDWFRPPRQLVLVFLVVAMASTGALAWLTWQLLQQDQAAERQRGLDRLEHAADSAVAAMQRELTALDGLLDRGIADASDLPAGILLILVAPSGVETRPADALLLYEPAGRSPIAADGRLLAAERLEFQDQLAAAARGYAALVEAPDVGTRAGALARLARVQRKARAHDDALTTYGKLATLGTASVEGIPAAIVARMGRLAILEGLERDADSTTEAQALRRDLRRGGLGLTQAQYRYYAAEADRRVGALPEDATQEARAGAVAWLWTNRDEVARRGRRVLGSNGRATLLLWQRSPSAISALVVDPDAVEQLVAASIGDGTTWALTDVEGRLLLGNAPPVRHAATRVAAATGLPWTFQVFEGEPTVSRSPRQRLLVFVLVSVAGLLAAGWYFIWQGISREMRAARLQADFVSAVSHEFRSPLTSLRHIAELLVHDRISTDGRRRQSYRLLASETDRLSRLVEGLLDFGRLQAGRLALHPEPLDLGALVAQVVTDFRSGLAGPPHRISFTPESTVIASVDRDAVTRAIWNLLDNAIKYSSPPAVVSVTLSSGGGLASIAIRDEGPGIAAAEQSRIFDRFVRGADAKVRRVAGTGIGLAIVREIARAHEGRVEVESRVDSGSTFTMWLPALDPASAAPVERDPSDTVEPGGLAVPAEQGRP